MKIEKMTKNLMIVGYGNITSEGVTLHFNEKVSLNGGLSSTQQWFSWDKIGQALFPEKYCELSAVSKRNLIRSEHFKAAQPGEVCECGNLRYEHRKSYEPGERACVMGACPCTDFKQANAELAGGE